MPEHECLYYHVLPEGRSSVRFAPCLPVTGGEQGAAGKVCASGKLYAANYGRISALALDPIEKNLCTIFIPAP